MKTSITSSRSSLFAAALALVLAAPAQAKLAAKVHALKGGAFTVLGGVTSALKADMDLEEGTELLVSDDASVTIGDFYDRRHHLSAGTHVAVADGSLVLKKGAVWTQSRGAKRPGSVATANLLVRGFQGEWVTIYDVAAQRTQITAISGEVDVASPQAPEFKYAVSAGMFTFADPRHEDGYPRSPTKLGYDSLMKTLALFPDQRSMDAGIAKVQEAASKRAPASAEAAQVADEPKGKIIVIKTIQQDSAQKYFLKHAPRTAKEPTQASSSVAPVRVLGLSSAPRPAARVPAAVAPKALEARPQAAIQSEFLKTIELHRREQPKQPQEVQRLIDDLQSFD